MLKWIRHILSFNGAIGRWEFFKVTWGFAIFPAILVLCSVAIKPEYKYFFMAVTLFGLFIFFLYLWIFLAAIFKRLNHIFSNRFIVIFLFFIYLGIKFALNTLYIVKSYLSVEMIFLIKNLVDWLLYMFLLFMPGRCKAEKIMSNALFFVNFILFISLFFVRRYYPITSYATSNSMTPTILAYDRFYVDIFNKEYSRGDIIVFRTVYKINYVKRIVGLPGDTIKIEGNNVYINGELLKEDYINTKTPPFNCTDKMVCGPIEIAEDTYFVLGDNRGNSHDSRFLGAINKEDIFGKVTHIFYPFNHRKSL